MTCEADAAEGSMMAIARSRGPIWFLYILACLVNELAV